MRPAHSARPALAALALAALAFAGCDAAGPDGAEAAAVSGEETAVVAAAALALDGGGALDAAADAAALGAAFGPAPPDAACAAERTYAAATQTWTRTVDCERGDPAGAFYARFGRTQTARFFDAAGAPQQDPETAAAADFAIVDGYGERRTPHLHHALLDIGAALAVTDLQADLVTVNGTYTRAATDTVRTRRGGVRTLTSSLTLTLDDVRGPRGHREAWRRAVGGTLTGHVEGTATFTAPDGQTRTRDFARDFTVTFGTGADADVALIRVGGATYRADLATGQVAGVD